MTYRLEAQKGPEELTLYLPTKQAAVLLAELLAEAGCFVRIFIDGDADYDLEPVWSSLG